MATEVREGTFAKITTEIAVGTRVRCRVALMELALVVEKQAKINARSGSHKYGTPTPARPGTGPATISGNLRRSITHTPIERLGDSYSIKVGTAVGFYPSYPGVTSRTPANKYGYYLEKKGLRNGSKYPFLMPAFEFAIRVPAQLIYNKAFGSGWHAVV